MYASGVFKTSSSQAQNHLNILFKRKTAVIEVVVNGRGIFDRLTDLQMETTAATKLKSGTFNLKTGKYGVLTTYTPTFTNANFFNFRTVTADTIRKIDL